MRADPFNKNNSFIPVQSYVVPLDAVGSNVSLPIAGTWIGLDKSSNGVIQIDPAGDASATSNGNAGLITLCPGDVYQVPHSAPRAYWQAQARAKAVVLYGTGEPPQLTDISGLPSMRGQLQSIGSQGVFNIVAAASGQMFNFTIPFAAYYDITLTAYYPVLTVDTLATALLFGVSDNSGGGSRAAVCTDSMCIVPSATGWDVVQTIRALGRGAYRPGEPTTSTLSYGFNLFTANAAVVTRNVSYRWIGILSL